MQSLFFQAYLRESSLSGYLHMAVTMNCAERGSILELTDFPDEIILKVFSNLDLKDLLRCGQVAKRFRIISHDKYLWQKIDQSGQNVSTAFIQFILDRGCKYLDLDNSKLEVNLKLTAKSQLRHLYLQNCIVDDESLEQLISSCQFLETLSLNHKRSTFPIPMLQRDTIDKLILQNRHSLQILNLSDCHGLDFPSFQQIIKDCVGLRELNLDFTSKIYNRSLSYLAQYLTPNIQKLSLRGHYISHYDLKVLVRRCNKITALDVINALQISAAALNTIIDNLPKLTHLVISKYFHFDPITKDLSHLEHHDNESLMIAKSKCPLYRVNQQCCPSGNPPETSQRHPEEGLRRVFGYFG